MSFNYKDIYESEESHWIYGWIINEIIKNKKITNINQFYEEINKIVVEDYSLWRKYRNANLDNINYSNENIQYAYMIRYCPIYYNTFSDILKNLKYLNIPTLNQSDIIKIALCCGGPASEAIGIIESLLGRKKFGKLNFSKIHFDIYDMHEWSYTRPIFKEIGSRMKDNYLTENNNNIEITYDDISLDFLDLNKTKEIFRNKKNYNFIFFQNALNEVIAQKNNDNLSIDNIYRFVTKSLIQESAKSLSKNGYLIFFDRSNKNNAYEQVDLFFKFLNFSLNDFDIELVDNGYKENRVLKPNEIPHLINKRYSVTNLSLWNKYKYRIFQKR